MNSKYAGTQEPFDAATNPDADETLADVMAFLRSQNVLRGKRDELVAERPLDALALSIVLQAAGNVRRAQQTVRIIRKENRESARRRASLERHKASDTLVRKLLKEPGVALAEARLTPEGCLRVIELWSCLGDALVSRDGWGEAESKFARALCGSADSGVRTTRDRIRLDRALDMDRQRPMRELVGTVERVMGHYVDRLMASLERLEPGKRNLHEVVLESVQEKAFELMSVIGVEDREAILRYREVSNAANSGRTRWAATRAYVASRIREWRAIRNALISETLSFQDDAEMESLGLAEMRKAEWARKGLSAAIADFQKTLALGKAIGLPELLSPKPPRPSRAAEAEMPVRVEKNSLPAVAADVRGYAEEMKVSKESASRTERASRNAQAKRKPGGISKLPRDPRGRFVAGAACTQPRGAGGRFVKAGANDAAGAMSQASTISHSLRPTSAGWQTLMAITPNVAGREQSARHGAASSKNGESCEVPLDFGPASYESEAAGATIVLADFGENGQNECLNPMPEASEAAEPFSGWPEDEDRGVAGDDQR
ncbi:hypothetical protein GC170_14140 [bacterium]|nr:hypothetical protein [bacterium]